MAKKENGRELLRQDNDSLRRDFASCRKLLEEERAKNKELENFAKTYYNCFLDSRNTNVDRLISNNDQYFLYCKANRLLGEPNGKRQ